MDPISLRFLGVTILLAGILNGFGQVEPADYAKCFEIVDSILARMEMNHG